MDLKTQLEVKRKKIASMKNPTIFMNKEDFEFFSKEVNSSEFYFRRIPVMIHPYILKGEVFVADNVFGF
jgi:hypothetical protein